MEFIPNWQKHNLKCYFCGETRSVKYSVLNECGQEVFACNKCAIVNGHSDVISAYKRNVFGFKVKSK